MQIWVFLLHSVWFWWDILWALFHHLLPRHMWLFWDKKNDRLTYM